tara:strand:- start:196 stop:483 length:288 start_codon:yes stop_codon:yes gene_type:complete
MEGFFKNCWMPIHKWQAQEELDQKVISCNIIRKEFSWFWFGDQLSVVKQMINKSLKSLKLKIVPSPKPIILTDEIMAKIRKFARSSNYSWVAPPC